MVLIGTAFSDCFTEPEKANAIYQLVFEQGMAVDYPLTMRHRDGTLTEVLYNASVYRDAGGKVLGVFAAARDVTKQRQAGAQYARSLLEAALDPLVTISPAGLITDVNEATVKVTGIPRQELIGTAFSDCFTEPEKANAIYQLVVEQGMAVDYPLTMRHRDETLTEVLYNASVYRNAGGKVLGVFAAARDVTEQKRAFVTAQRMAAIVEYSDDAIIGKTLDGIITSWNPAAERLYGYCSEEIIGRPVELLSPEGREGEMRTILAQIRSGQRVDNFETIRVRKDGTVFPVSLTVSPICDGDGMTVGASTIARDMTEQQQAAENVRSLAAAEDLVRTVMASASIGIALADMDGSFRVVNGSLRDLLGFDEEWFLAHRMRDMVHPDDVEGALKERARFLAGSSDKSSTKLRLVRADGATVWVRRVAVQIHGGAGQPNMLMVQLEDITAEHEAQEALTYQAFHDSLTGLHNRAWILDILKVDLRAAKRLGHSVGVLFVDLDNFKVVNESLGHAAGDKVLATVADRIVAGLRPGGPGRTLWWGRVRHRGPGRPGRPGRRTLRRAGVHLDRHRPAGTRPPDRADRLHRYRRVDLDLDLDPREPAARCRLRAVPRQGRRSGELALLRRGDARPGCGPPHR